MSVVAYANYKVDQAKNIRNRLHKHKVHTEELEDVVLALDQLCENRLIPKLVNDEVIETYKIMTELDPKAGYLKAGLSNAKARSDELSDLTTPRIVSRLCNSDAQIARLQAYLNEANTIVRKQHSQGKISSVEVQDIVLEIEWLHLMVSVISNIAQGHKSYNRHDVLAANAFYKKAQTELIRSGHPYDRRHQMIKQLADVLFGRRRSLDTELMPEDEFNPDNAKTNMSEEDQRALTEILKGVTQDGTELPDISEAMLIENQAKNQRQNSHKSH